MKLFQSLGSNFRLGDVLAQLVASGSKDSQSRLRTLLSKKYGGEIELFYKGRNALAAAVEAATEKGDKVAINGFTCYVVTQAIKSMGRVPIFLDIREEDLHFGAEELKEALKKHKDIKAVIVQNTLGIPCDIVAIEEVAKNNNLVLVEDLAHSIGIQYADGRMAGTVGDFVMLSFGRDKMIDVVNGGALITRNKTYFGITPRPNNNPGLADRVRDRWYPLLTWKVRVSYAIGLGRLLQKMYMGMSVIKRSADGDIKINQGLPSWYCSRALQELGALDSNLEVRKRVVDAYALGLPGETKPRGLLRFAILSDNRAELLDAYKKNGIYLSDVWYDTPIYPNRFTDKSGYVQGSCLVAESIAKRIINLPTHRNVSQKHLQELIRITNELSS